MNEYSIPIPDLLFEEILNQAIRRVLDPRQKKIPKKQVLMLEFLREIGEQGASALEIYRHLEASGALERKKGPSPNAYRIACDIEDLAKVINQKLGKYFFSLADEEIIDHMFMVQKRGRNIDRRYFLKYIRNPIITREISNMWVHGSRNCSVSSEMKAIYKLYPYQIDFSGVSFLSGLSLPEFKEMLIQQCSSDNPNTEYRFLFPDPKDINVMEYLEKLFRREMPRYCGLKGRTKDSIHILSHLRKDLMESGIKITVKTHGKAQPWRFRYMRVLGKREYVYLRMYSPQGKEALLKIEAGGYLYHTLRGIFEEKWAAAKEVDYEDYSK